MSKSFRCIVFSLIVFLALQQVVTGLKCYMCYACASPINLVTIESGASGYSCTKVTLMSEGQVIDVTRGSSATSTCYEYNTVVGGTGYFQNCCTGDACNKSIAHSSSLCLLFVVVTIVGILKSFITN